MKLVGVARASMEELLLDYEDFLRQRNFSKWGKNDRQANEVRQLAYAKYRSYTTYKTYISNHEIATNVATCLIHQTNFLLDQQLKALSDAFVQNGGFTERLYRSRSHG